MYTGGFAKTFWNLNFLNVNGYPSFNTIRPPSTSGAYLKKGQNNAALSYVYFVFLTFLNHFPFEKWLIWPGKLQNAYYYTQQNHCLKKNDIKSDLAV